MLARSMAILATRVEGSFADRRGEVIERNRQQLQFSHHKSSLDELVILEATFELEESEVKYLTQRMQTLWIVKRTNQRPFKRQRSFPL